MRIRLLSLLIPALLLAACAGTSAEQPFEPSARLSAVSATGGSADAGFARAEQPRAFVFPQDHGAHPEYATEWWYYTGNLDSADGRHFGFQLTFFRSGLEAQPAARESDWGTSQIYMAHFTLTDVAGGQFYPFERFSRAAAGLAGASGQPYRVWLDDWSAEGSGAEGMAMRLRAAEGAVALDISARAELPPLLQGDHGLSQKGAQAGNASYYYSLPRMDSQGSISVAGQRFDVRGLTWMDHEFGTSALDPGAAGWDWLGLQLSDGRALTYARIRKADGSASLALGALAAADGSKAALDPAQVQLEALGQWRSPHTGVTYPSGWRLSAPGLDLRLTPWLADQELPLTISYWEGAVRIEGSADGAPISGNGYVELTGYADQPGQVQVR